MFPMDPDTYQYFTILYGVLQLSTGEFKYVSAGHPSLIHVPSTGTAYQRVSQSTPIGFFVDTKYETETLVLQPGDRLFLFSDGLLETRNDADELFGHERVLAAMQAHRLQGIEAAVQGVASEAKGWHKSSALEDDLTVMGIEWHASRESG